MKLKTAILSILSAAAIIFLPLHIAAQDTYPPVVDLEGTTKQVIVIDPAHGGGEWGVTVKGIHEKEITEKIAVLIKEKIEKSMNGVDVYLTRDAGEFKKQEDRVGMANNLKASVYVSINCDYIQGTNISGYKVFYMSGDEKKKTEDTNVMTGWDEAQLFHVSESQRLSSYISQYLQAALIPESSSITGSEDNDVITMPSRGEKAAPLMTLNGLDMPAVVVEIGNLNNREDTSFLNNKEELNRVAYHIKEGIVNYLKDSIAAAGEGGKGHAGEQ